MVSQAEKRWHKGDAVFIKSAWVGRTEILEHVVLLDRVFSRTIPRRDPSRRHEAAFVNNVKGPPDAEWFFRGRPRKNLHYHPILVGENMTHNPDLPDNTADSHSQSPKETRAHRNFSGIQRDKMGWKCTWMTCTVLALTHKC